MNAKGDPTTRITVGKQVTRDLFVAYSSDVGSTQGSVYQLDYALQRDFHFTSIRDQDGSVGGDFKYILRGKPPAAPGITGPVPVAPRLGVIRLDGVLRFKERTIKRQLRVKEGRTRDRAAINDGVDRLVEFYRKHGYWMADVDYHEAPGTDGAVDVTFHVRTGPRVTIDIQDASAGDPKEVATAEGFAIFNAVDQGFPPFHISVTAYSLNALAVNAIVAYVRQDSPTILT